jgi:hypothetical protein
MKRAEREDLIAAARAKHGSVEVIELRPDDEPQPIDGDPAASDAQEIPPFVVVRSMALGDFVQLQHDEARRSAGEILRDPRTITGSLLECVVCGADDAESEVADCPGFERDLMNAVSELAGALRDDLDVEPVTALDGKGPIEIRVGKEVLTFRRLNNFDYSNARSAIGKHRGNLRHDFLSPLALLEIVRAQAADKPACERILRQWPACVQPLGVLLYHSAMSRAERRRGK